MDKNLILEILNDWNFWQKELPTGNKRRGYLKLSLDWLNSSEVVLAIVGVRRAGKSYLMRQIASSLISRRIKKENILMVNFEDQRFAQFYPELLQEIYETYLEFLKPSGQPLVLLDEVHNVPGWERWVRTMHELGKAKIVISGSSSKLLAGELATVLTGRHLDVHVFPLSFEEFLGFKGVKIKNQLEMLSHKIKIKGFLREYLEYGGFPAVALAKEKKRLLLTYFDDILTKDVEKRHQVKRTEALRALARFYLTNIANPVTFNSIRKVLNTATVTAEKFSSYLEEANLVFFIKRFSFSVKEQEKSARKVYTVDGGIANAVGFRFSENLGRLIENIVAIELKRKQSRYPGLEVYYWKWNEREVDFVVKEGLEVKEMLQVCWNLDDPEVKKRELKPLLKALKKLKLKLGKVITEDYEGEEKIGDQTIKFIPLWKWLLLDH